MAATATKKKGAKKAPKRAAPARKKAVTPARKKAARVVKKPAAAAPAAPQSRTAYFREYQSNRRAAAVKAKKCIECAVEPRAVEKNPETGKLETVSTRCVGCRDRARDSSRRARGSAPIRAKYPVILETTATGFSAYLPDLPGCVAAGRTRDEVIRRIGQAAEMHVESLRAQGETVPLPSGSATVPVTVA
jgi:predicted RNase H-like HicB family nuclease